MKFLRSTLLTLTLSVVLSLSFAGFVFSETESSLTETPDTEVSFVDDGDMSEDAVLDQQVLDEDFGLEEARVLPDNKVLYGFKRFGRGVKKAFTFDKTKKAKLEIEYANREIVDHRRLYEQRGDEVADIVIKGFDKADKNLKNVAKRAEDLGKASEEERREFAELLLDSEIKRQKVLEHFESETEDERIIERVQEVREDFVEHVGDVFEDMDVDEDIFDRVLENQRGSEFKDLRNLEVLKRIEGHVPEEHRKGIRKAQENAFDRVREHADDPRFGEYIDNFGGDNVARFDLLDDLEEQFGDEDLPEEIREKIKRARDLSARAFQRDFENLDHRVQDGDRRERMRHDMLERFRVDHEEVGEEFVDDMSHRLERMAEFRSHIQLEELEQDLHRVEKEEISAFVDAFPDAKADADRAMRTMDELRKAAAEGDFEKVKMFEKVLNELEQKQFNDPAKAEWLRENFEGARDEAERGFAEDFEERLRLEGDAAFDEFISDDEDQLEYLRKFKEEFRDHEDFDISHFDRAINDQFEHFSEEERRLAEELDRDEREFRNKADKKREELREALESKLQEASPEEHSRLMEEFHKKEEEFRKSHDSKELELFRRQWEVECGVDGQCLDGRKAEYNKKQEFFKQQREAEKELREVERELHDFAEEKRRENEDRNHEDGFNPFEGICDGPEECIQYCEGNDDPKCRRPQNNEERPLGEFGSTDPFVEFKKHDEFRDERFEEPREFEEFENKDNNEFRFEERDHEERFEFKEEHRFDQPRHEKEFFEERREDVFFRDEERHDSFFDGDDHHDIDEEDFDDYPDSDGINFEPGQPPKPFDGRGNDQPRFEKTFNSEPRHDSLEKNPRFEERRDEFKDDREEPRFEDRHEERFDNGPRPEERRDEPRPEFRDDKQPEHNNPPPPKHDENGDDRR